MILSVRRALQKSVDYHDELSDFYRNEADNVEGENTAEENKLAKLHGDTADQLRALINEAPVMPAILEARATRRK